MILKLLNYFDFKFTKSFHQHKSFHEVKFHPITTEKQTYRCEVIYMNLWDKCTRRRESGVFCYCYIVWLFNDVFVPFFFFIVLVFIFIFTQSYSNVHKIPLSFVCNFCRYSSRIYQLYRKDRECRFVIQRTGGSSEMVDITGNSSITDFKVNFSDWECFSGQFFFHLLVGVHQTWCTSTNRWKRSTWQVNIELSSSRFWPLFLKQINRPRSFSTTYMF